LNGEGLATHPVIPSFFDESLSEAGLCRGEKQVPGAPPFDRCEICRIEAGAPSRGLARIMHEPPAPTADMAVLPGVLGSRSLRRTEQVRLSLESLRLPGGTTISTIS
jgi:hypothetical protein